MSAGADSNDQAITPGNKLDNNLTLGATKDDNPSGSICRTRSSPLLMPVRASYDYTG